ncbi:hypothetical protein BH11BAC7_BH11BAC7_28070 [soil metagenome]
MHRYQNVVEPGIKPSIQIKKVKKSKLLLHLIFALLTNNCFGQEDGTTIFFPDTLQFSSLKKSTLLNLAPSRIEIFDTIENPNFYLARFYPEPYQQCISLVVKQKNSWDVYEIIQNAGAEIIIERVNFNGKGKKELVIYYAQSNGISQWTHGWAEHQKGIAIIDLDKYNLLANIENYNSHTDWFAEYESDEPDTIDYTSLQTTGGDIYGSNYIVSIFKGKLVLTESEVCNDFDEKIVNNFTKPRIIIYALGKNSLIRKPANK